MKGSEHIPSSFTKKCVRSWVMRGLNQSDMAKRLAICVDTLVKHYHAEIYYTKIDMDCAIEDQVFQKAKEGDWRAIELYLKCRAGWAYAKPPEERDPNSSKALLYQLKEFILSNGQTDSTSAE